MNVMVVMVALSDYLLCHKFSPSQLFTKTLLAAKYMESERSMSYIINNSRGQVIATVQDGTVNTTATDLTLVGQGVTNYGTAENENYVYLLENFANNTAPLQPILGQLWYQANTDTIHAYNSANTWAALNWYRELNQILEDKKKIEVSVLIFGRKTPMELSYMQVEKLS